jgi:hypothetical protein
MGETKLKLLAITLGERFHCYLDLQSRRNVYHCLHDLTRLGLVK